MVTGYDLVKTLHVLFAIAAVGVNLAYPMLLARAKGRPELAHVLSSVKRLDDRIATPSYVLLLVSGGALVQMGGWSWGAPFLTAALGLYIGLAVTAIAIWSPVLRRAVVLAEAQGPGGPDMDALLRRLNVLGALLMAVALAILFLMVTKPALW